MGRFSTDLEFVFDHSGDQVVGVRFASVVVLANALITNAWVQFTADESNSVATHLTVHAEASAASRAVHVAELQPLQPAEDGSVGGMVAACLADAWRRGR